MFTRHKVLLRFIYNEEESCSKIRLMKLSFILRQKSHDLPGNAVYDFVPYKYGPFSFTLYHDLAILEKKGYINIQDKDIFLGDKTKHLDRDLGALSKVIDSLSRSYTSIKTKDLIDEVYEKYPWYTVNSKDHQKRNMKKKSAEFAIYAIGYEGLMVDALVDILLKNGINQLVDIRKNPIARRYGFHKSTLGHICNELNIEYIHLPQFGIPSSWRKELNRKDLNTYKSLFMRYHKEILPMLNDDMPSLNKLFSKKPSALLCMEHDPTFCHRRFLAKHLMQEYSLKYIELRH